MRRSLVALTGLLAGLLVSAAPDSVASAQNQIAPVAIAIIGDESVDDLTGVTKVELDGSGSFDPDPGGSISKYQWELLTEAYQWIGIANEDQATASFEVPSAELAARYGPSIEFRLTVTDSGSPPATASTTVTFNVNRGPVADIAVSAKLKALLSEQIDGYDDDGDGVVDENTERYTREGVIHGPGDNGNADYEWDIREGSLLVVDGSGSYDADGPLPPSAFNWELLYASDVASVTSNLPDLTEGQRVLSTDEDPEVPASVLSETVGRLPFVRGGADNSYYLYYLLTVTDEHGVSDSQVVKIVIRDAHDNPEVEIEFPEYEPDVFGTGNSGEHVQAAGEDRYVISSEAAAEGVTLTAVGSGDVSARTRELVHTWSGTGVEPSQSNQPGRSTTAVFTAPEGTVEGDSFTVEVEVVDPDGLPGSTAVELVVADTGPPTATAPPNIETPDGTDGGFPVTDPPSGVVTLRGFGFDPDSEPLTFQWEQVGTSAGAPLTVAYRGPRIVLNGSTTQTAWFTLPEVTRGTRYVVYVQFTVTDQWGVSDSEIVTITIHDGDDDLKAIAGPPLRVQPGEFVRLRGSFSSGLVSADAIDAVTRSWTYIGIETHPRTERRSPITDAEKAEGFVFGQWFPNADGTYEPDAGGRVLFTNGRYPYFDAPELGGFNSVKLIFEFAVGGVVGQESDTDTVAVTVFGPYFSGDVGSADYCANLSLGGATTYPFDSDEDGVADTCSLRTTRRAAVARRNALETLATLNPEAFTTALQGEVDDPDTDEDESTEGTCATAPDDLGDLLDELSEDVCALAKRDDDPESSTPTIPAPVDPSLASLFFSGVIDGPNFCVNRSLGGPTTYAFDSDEDGVAETCSLPYTRREAVARQRALETAFATHPQFKSALAAACTALGTLDFGDLPDALATDACNPSAQEDEKGQPLPSPSG